MTRKNRRTQSQKTQILAKEKAQQTAAKKLLESIYGTQDK